MQIDSVLRSLITYFFPLPKRLSPLTLMSVLVSLQVFSWVLYAFMFYRVFLNFNLKNLFFLLLDNLEEEIAEDREKESHRKKVW